MIKQILQRGDPASLYQLTPQQGRLDPRDSSTPAGSAESERGPWSAGLPFWRSWAEVPLARSLPYKYGESLVLLGLPWTEAGTERQSLSIKPLILNAGHHVKCLMYVNVFGDYRSLGVIAVHCDRGPAWLRNDVDQADFSRLHSQRARGQVWICTSKPRMSPRHRQTA